MRLNIAKDRKHKASLFIDSPERATFESTYAGMLIDGALWGNGRRAGQSDLAHTSYINCGRAQGLILLVVWRDGAMLTHFDKSSFQIEIPDRGLTVDGSFCIF